MPAKQSPIARRSVRIAEPTEIWGCSRAKANKVQAVDELKIEEVFAETGDDTPVTSEESKTPD